MTTIKTPAYARFVNTLAAKFAALDIPLVPLAEEGARDGLHGPDGWVLFQVRDTEDKLYAKRTRGGDPTVIETTIPFDLIPSDLVVKRVTDNGKIEARVVVDVERLASGLLPVFASRLTAGDKLRASKAPVRRASEVASGPDARDTELASLRASQADLKARLEAEEAARLAAMETATLRA